MNKEYYCDPRKHTDCGKRGCDMKYCRLTRYKECAICDAWGNPIEHTVTDTSVRQQEEKSMTPAVNLRLVINKEQLEEMSKKVDEVNELLKKAKSLVDELASVQVDIQSMDIITT